MSVAQGSGNMMAIKKAASDSLAASSLNMSKPALNMESGVKYELISMHCLSHG